jgi:NADP-dependent 3-hydroxy acid dehydrogenase YdfG
MSADPGAVLITGCSSGIGRETARRLAGRGWTVYATARRPEPLAELERSGCRTLALDVTDEGSMSAAVNAVEGEQGAVGRWSTTPATASPARWRPCRSRACGRSSLVLPAMRAARRGTIVNLSSMGGKLTFPGGGAYHASKHAVEALSDALRWEVGGFGVRVVIVEPGLITTRFGETAAGSIADAGSAGSADDDPYAAFNAAVGSATLGAYEGPLARLGGGPDAVARVIERAISARNPRPRYKVTASARLAMAQRALLPDRAWDAVMRSQFSAPGE